MWYTLLFLLMMLLMPAAAIGGSLNGLRICANSVIPSLFPFFVVTRILIAKMPNISKRIFGIHPQILSALIISFLGGYPNGISAVTSLYEKGELEKHEAENAILFCNNSGPGFFIGMIGTVVLQNQKAGIILYLIHILSALLCLLIFYQKRNGYKIHRVHKKSPTFSQCFLSAVSDSCSVMLQVCGLILFFGVLTAVIQATGILDIASDYIKALIFGSLELTSGIAKLGNSQVDFVLCAFLTGWGGFCVHMQAMNLCRSLTPKGYYLSKLLHGIFSAFFAYVYLKKTLILTLCVIAIMIIFILFPLIRQKWGRNNRKAVV